MTAWESGRAAEPFADWLTRTMAERAEVDRRLAEEEESPKPRWPGQDAYEERLREQEEHRKAISAEIAARQTITGDWSNAGHTVPLNRKTFHVTVHGLDDPHAALLLLWERFGDRADRTVRNNMTVTHGSVDGPDLKIVVDYIVRGGHPADFRRWLGKLFFGGPVTDDVVDARLVRTVQYVHGPLGPAREVVRKD